jgi:hypothetical protein
MIWFVSRWSVIRRKEREYEEGEDKFGGTAEKVAAAAGVRQRSGPRAVRAMTRYRHCQQHRYLVVHAKVWADGQSAVQSDARLFNRTAT